MGLIRIFSEGSMAHDLRRVSWSIQLYGWIRMLHRDIKPENGELTLNLSGTASRLDAEHNIVMPSTPAEGEWAGLPTSKWHTE
jgi:hypothetical protein